MIKCQFCASENESWYIYCQNCGKKVAPEKSAEATDSIDSFPSSDFKIGSRSTDVNPTPLDEMLSEQATMALEEPLLSKAAVDSPAPGSKPQDDKDAAAAVSASKRAAFGDLLVECPKCRESVPKRHSFCGYCGVSLGGPGSAGRESREAAVLPSLSDRVPAEAVATLMRVREDGSFDCGLSLREGEMSIGRESGDLSFPADALMSKRHARIITEGTRMYLEDLGSTNGTFLRLKGKKQLQNGDYLLIGKQLLRFEVDAPGSVQAPTSASQTLVLGSLIGKFEAKLVKRLPSGKDSNEFPLTETTISIGREKGEILFKNDPFVSSRHARIQLEAGSYTLEDLNSSNGTYLRLRQKEEIGHEDFFIAGEQLFQVRLLSR